MESFFSSLPAAANSFPQSTCRVSVAAVFLKTDLFLEEVEEY